MALLTMRGNTEMERTTLSALVLRRPPQAGVSKDGHGRPASATPDAVVVYCACAPSFGASTRLRISQAMVRVQDSSVLPRMSAVMAATGFPV